MAGQRQAKSMAADLAAERGHHRHAEVSSRRSKAL
jgi:hypothetical protein